MKVIELENKALTLLPLEWHHEFKRTSRQSINRPVVDLCLTKYKYYETDYVYSNHFSKKIYFSELLDDFKSSIHQIINVYNRDNEKVKFYYCAMGFEVPNLNERYKVEYQYIPSFGWDNDEIPLPKEITIDILVLAVLADYYDIVKKYELRDKYLKEYEEKLKEVWKK